MSNETADSGRRPHRNRPPEGHAQHWPENAGAAGLRLRVAEQIGAPLDAEVTLYGTPAWTSALKPLGDELRFVLITSEARVADADTRAPEALATDGEGKSGLWLHVQRSESQKCARCWHRRPDVGTVTTHPELCGRCAVNLDGPGETRRYA